MLQSNLSRAFVLAGSLLLTACDKESVSVPMPVKQVAKIEPEVLTGFEISRRALIARFQVVEAKFKTILTRYESARDILQTRDHPTGLSAHQDSDQPERVDILNVIDDLEYRNKQSGNLLTNVSAMLAKFKVPLKGEYMAANGMQYCQYLQRYKDRKSDGYLQDMKNLVAYDQGRALLEEIANLQPTMIFFPESLTSMREINYEFTAKLLTKLEADVRNFDLSVAQLESSATENAPQLNQSFLGLWEQRLLMTLSEDKCWGEFNSVKAQTGYVMKLPAMVKMP